MPLLYSYDEEVERGELILVYQKGGGGWREGGLVENFFCFSVLNLA